jgi:hypothetical protein
MKQIKDYVAFIKEKCIYEESRLSPPICGEAHFNYKDCDWLEICKYLIMIYFLL